MRKITIYGVQSAGGEDLYELEDYDEAYAGAALEKGKLIARVYEQVSEEAEADFTEKPAGPVRTAHIERCSGRLGEIRAYMPSNYKADELADGTIVITGSDNAGWTLDGYVIPRLASGLIFAREVTA